LWITFAPPFLIADGVIPSNEGEGMCCVALFVERCATGINWANTNLFLSIDGPLVEIMGEPYPELVKAQPLIEQLIEQEECQFSRTLAKGLKILDQAVESLREGTLPGMLFSNCTTRTDFRRI